MVGYDRNTAGGDFEWRVEKRDPSRPASKLAITVSPSSVTAGSWTTKYTVQKQDVYSNPVTMGSTTVIFASTSTGAAKRFAETSGGGAVASVTIPDGSSSKDFYCYDELAGAWTISVSAAGLTGDSKPLTVNPKTGCVIATATYGSELAPEVAYMRHVRDVMIGSNQIGRTLVDGWNTFYYSWSPLVAEYVANSESLQAIFRVSLLPLVAVIHSTACVYTAIASFNPPLASTIAFLFAATSSTMIYATIPLLLLQFIIKKRFKFSGAILRKPRR